MCPVSQCYKQSREYGIGLGVSISTLKSASNFVRSNATRHYLFRMNDAESIYEASRTLMLPPHGELRLNSLQPGECLVKQIGPWPHAMVGQIDYMPPCRTCAVHYDKHPYMPAKRLKEMPKVLQALKEKISEHREQAREKSVKDVLPSTARELLDYAFHDTEGPGCIILEFQAGPLAGWLDFFHGYGFAGPTVFVDDDFPVARYNHHLPWGQAE